VIQEGVAYLDGAPITLAEAQAWAASDPVMVAERDASLAERTTRAALSDAVALAALSPYPTAEEQAIIDSQVTSALALFRALPDPPADVLALAAAVLTLEVA
jgi:hypothetical protein